MEKNEREMPFTMHLQWFGDAAVDDGADDGGFHDVNAAVGEEEYEILRPDQPDPVAPSTEPEEFKGKTREQLLADIQAERQKAAELAKKSDATEVIAEGLKRLSQVPAQAAPAAPVDQWKDSTEEEVNQSFIDNPYKHTNKIVQDQLRKLTPDLQRVLLNNKEYSRRFAMMEGDLKFVFDNYSSEVETVVNGFDVREQISNVDVYKKAAELVRARHFIEIRDAAVAAELARIDKETKSQASAGAGRAPSFNEGSSRPATKTKVYIRPTAEDYKRMESKGIDTSDPNDVARYMKFKYPNGRTTK